MTFRIASAPDPQKYSKCFKGRTSIVIKSAKKMNKFDISGLKYGSNNIFHHNNI